MVPSSLWPSLASTRDFNWITGDVQEHFLSSMQKQTTALRKVTAQQGWRKKLAHGEQKQEAFSPWCITIIGVMRSKALLSKKVPEQRWCSDHLKDYLSKRKKNESDLHFVCSTSSLCSLGCSSRPWPPVWCFLGLKNTDSSLSNKEVFFKPQTVGKNPERTWRRAQTLQFGCWSFKLVKWCSGFTQKEAASRLSQSKVKFFSIFRTLSLLSLLIYMCFTWFAKK